MKKREPGIKRNRLSGRAAIAYFFYLLAVVVIALEIFLRMYNPFSFRQKGDRVLLPRNRIMKFSNEAIPVLPRQIIHTKNSMGFRGPEMPLKFPPLHSVIAVGGSTTECFYLDDSSCWTAKLALRLKKKFPDSWVNNAGFQGHSTYGHFILINEFIKYLHPGYILMMVGCNEVNRHDIGRDESLSKKSSHNSPWGWLKRNSEVVELLINLHRLLLAERLHVVDRYVDLKTHPNGFLVLSQATLDSLIRTEQPLVDAYRQRLERIADTCQANHIRLVLITQPSLFGKGRDPVTGCDLETYILYPNYNGLAWWKVLEMYNTVTRQLAASRHLPLIDLAAAMPKSSRYFYDFCHFTPEGAGLVGDIIAAGLQEDMDKQPPESGKGF